MRASLRPPAALVARRLARRLVGDALLPAQDQEAELPGGADQEPLTLPTPEAPSPGHRAAGVCQAWR
eukprot:SM000133S26774  [mRNA]  locus=s133:45058:45360:+ [translate_table: standard]